MINVNINTSYTMQTEYIDNHQNFASFDGLEIQVHVNKRELAINEIKAKDKPDGITIYCDVEYTVRGVLLPNQGIEVNDSDEMFSYKINVRTNATANGDTSFERISNPDDEVHQMILAVAYQFAITQTRAFLSNTHFHFVHVA